MPDKYVYGLLKLGVSGGQAHIKQVTVTATTQSTAGPHHVNCRCLRVDSERKKQEITLINIMQPWKYMDNHIQRLVFKTALF